MRSPPDRLTIAQHSTAQHSTKSFFLVLLFLILSPIYLTACGGGGGGNAGTTNSDPTTLSIADSYAPLNIDATPQPDLKFVLGSDLSKWVELEKVDDADPDSPASVFQVPVTEAVEEGKIYIINQRAYKVTGVFVEAGEKIVHVAEPEIKEVFSSLKLEGDMPMVPFEVEAQSTAVQAKTTTSAKVAAKSEKSLVDWGSTKGYKTGDFLDIYKCLKGNNKLKTFEGVTLMGVEVSLDDCALNDAKKPITLNASLGIYPTMKVNEGFDLADEESFTGRLEFQAYYSLTGNVAIADKEEYSRIFRMLSAKGKFLVPIPTPVGPVPVLVTAWFPLDLIAQGEVEGKAGINLGSIEGKVTYKSNEGIRHKKLSSSNLQLEANLNASSNLLFRPGVGLGLYDLYAFSIHPKIGVGANFEHNFITSCSKASVKAVGGIDMIIFPTTGIDLRRESKLTKELLALSDISDPFYEYPENGADCVAPKANITISKGAVPYESIVNVNNKKIIIPDESYIPVRLNANTSVGADAYKWYIASQSGSETAFLGEGLSYNFTRADLEKITAPAKIDLFIMDKSGNPKTKSSVNLAMNQKPMAGGWLLGFDDEPKVLSLKNASSDVDGEILVADWYVVNDDGSEIYGGRLHDSNGKNRDIKILRKFFGNNTPRVRIDVTDDSGAYSEVILTEERLQNSGKNINAELRYDNVHIYSRAERSTVAAKTLTGTEIPYSLYVHTKVDDKVIAASKRLLSDSDGKVSYDFGAWAEKLIEKGIDYTKYYLVFEAGDPNRCDPTIIRQDDLSKGADFGTITLCSGEQVNEGELPINNVVSGSVKFVDAAGKTISVPSDAWVRLTPSRFQNDASHYHSVKCKVANNGVFGATDCYTEDETTNLKQAFSDSGETFQIAVFKNHIESDQHDWNCGEDVYRFVDNNAANNSWTNLLVYPSDYQDRSGEQCTSNIVPHMSGTLFDISRKRLIVYFDVDMKDSFHTTGDYVPLNSFWSDKRTFIIDFDSYTPGGAITLHKDGFLSSAGVSIPNDYVRTFPK